jgi:hypothetical protein
MNLRSQSEISLQRSRHCARPIQRRQVLRRQPPSVHWENPEQNGTARKVAPVPGLPQLLVCDLINHYSERAAHVCAHAEIQLGRADGLIQGSKTGEIHTICHRSAPCAV